MKRIYLVSVNPETPNQMPKIYFAVDAKQVELFIDKYSYGSVSVKCVEELPDMSDNECDAN